MNNRANWPGVVCCSVLAAVMMFGCASGGGGGGGGGGAFPFSDPADDDECCDPGVSPTINNPRDPTLSPADPIPLDDDPDEVDPPTTAALGDALLFETDAVAATDGVVVEIGGMSVPAELVVADDGVSVEIVFDLPADLEPGEYDLVAIEVATGETLAEGRIEVPRTLTSEEQIEVLPLELLFVEAAIDPDSPIEAGSQFAATVGGQVASTETHADGLLLEIPAVIEPGPALVVVTERETGKPVLIANVTVLEAE
ncbi:MAG: hypothetical protein GY778_21745 [bacterium]|nr:hypothetical protein [bacterium]